MTILTGYKYKLLPSHDQLQSLNQNCGNRRMVYKLRAKIIRVMTNSSNITVN